MSIEQTSLADFGYQFLGPICTHYFQSLNDQLDDRNTKVMYLAREGYFFKKAYAALLKRNLIKSVPHDYVLASRTFLFRISIADPQTWELSLGHKFTGSLQKLLVARFGFSTEVIRTLYTQDQLEEEYSLPQDLTQISELLTSQLDALKKVVSRSRDDYMSYLRQIGLHQYERLLMVDVGYSGTIQKLMTRLLHKSTEGLYFITTSAGTIDIGDNTATIIPVFKDGVSMGGGYYMLDRSLFLEALLTAPEGQFIDIKKLHLPVASDTNSDLVDQQFHYFYGRRSYTQDHFMALDALFDGAIEAIVDNFEANIKYSVDEIETLFQTYTTSRANIPRAVWPLFELDDAISGNANVSPMQLFRL